MGSPRTIIFDWDGTLFDSYRKGNLKIVAESRGLKLPENFDPKKYWGKNTREIIAELWPEEDVQKFYSAWESQDVEIVPMVDKAPLVLEFINNLHLPERVFCGILTSRRMLGLSKLLDARKVRRYFDPELIYTSCMTKHPKPDPQAFNGLATQLFYRGISNKETIFVGDTLEDFQTVKDGGIEFVGVLTGPMTREEWLNAGLARENILTSVADLPMWLLVNGKISVDF